MPKRYLDVESLDGVVVRCEVLEWDAQSFAPDMRLFLPKVSPQPRALVLRPDTGEVVLVTRTTGSTRPAFISSFDPYEDRHEWDWPGLAERLERHTNHRSK